MKSISVPLVLAWLCACVILRADPSSGLKGQPDALNAVPAICVIIRTYWGHGGDSHSGLRALIASLQRQSVKECAFGAGAKAFSEMSWRPVEMTSCKIKDDLQSAKNDPNHKIEHDACLDGF